MSFFLFTYGTLLSGQCRHEILENEEFIQEYALNGIKLYNYYDDSDKNGVQNYPVSLKGTASDVVLGEIYLCEDYLRQYLDQMEQVGTLYNVYSFPLKINGVTEHILVYIGIDKTWSRCIGQPFLKRYPSNTIWKPTKN